MPVTDPIADMLARIRNAVTARHARVRSPASKMKLAIADVLADEGFIKSYETHESASGPQPELDIELLYKEGRGLRPRRPAACQPARPPRLRSATPKSRVSTAASASPSCPRRAA